MQLKLTEEQKEKIKTILIYYGNDVDMLVYSDKRKSSIEFTSEENIEKFFSYFGMGSNIRSLHLIDFIIKNNIKNMKELFTIFSHVLRLNHEHKITDDRRNKLKEKLDILKNKYTA